MSIELPEARILAEQMNETLLGKRIRSYRLQHVENLQRIGFMNKDAKSFDQLVNGKIEAVVSRGNVIRVKLDRGMNLILAPEYGGKILYHSDNNPIQEEYHLRVDFSDDTALTVRLTGMGGIYALKDDELGRCYVYRRDFSEVLSPADEKAFTLERFSKFLASKNTSLKSVLVGKDAVVVGLGNTTFQDILYRAKIYPRRKASELNENVKHALYDAIRLVLQERTRLGGKKQFIDLYGKQGKYTSAMGSNIKTCTVCGASIEKLSLGGGQTHFCPKCQKR